MSLPSRLRPALIATAVAVALSAWFLINNAGLGQSGILPLDDSYIHLQYGWQAAHGNFLRYNSGEAPTTGATSLLYMLVLALGFAAGVNRECALTLTLVMGVVSFALSAALVADAARRLASSLGFNPNVAGLVAGLWFAGSGWMAWGFLSGMETGLLILFVCGALWAYVTQRLRWAAICMALAALTRPEAGLLSVAFIAAEVLAHEAGALKDPKHLLLIGLPSLAMLVSPAVNYIVTGDASATGFLAKSWFTVQPFDLTIILRQIGATLIEISLRLSGGLSSDGHWHAFPALQLFAIIGLIKLYRHNRMTRRVALLSAGWAAGILVATATLQTATWHHYRYQMPIYPTLVLTGALAAAWLAAGLGSLSRLAQAVLLLLAGVWPVFSGRDFVAQYAADTRTVLRMEIVLANWLRDNTPSNASVVVHDVGAIRYISERRTIDTVGLTTAGMSSAYRNGPGAIYETLRHLHPEYYAVNPGVGPPYFGIATASELLSEELFRVHLPGSSPYVSASDTQVIARARWDEASRVELPQQPDMVERTRQLTQVDAINIADLADEQAHQYTWWDEGRLAGFSSDVRQMTYRADPVIALTDGGRIINGGQAFVLSSHPGQPLLLITRVHQTTDVAMQVEVGQDLVGEWQIPAIPGEWLESAFIIPARFIRGVVTHIRMTVQPAPADARFSPFFLWGYQGTLTEQTLQPTVMTEVAFGHVAELLGYDLPVRQVSPSGVLPLTLYWRKLDPPLGEWRYFVHLIDPNNDTAAGIIAQVDSAPRRGTYPFWVWNPTEVISETAFLQIPENTVPANYDLLAGIYDSADGTRTQLESKDNYGHDRFLLASISIR